MWQGKVYVEHCAVFGLATSGGIQGHIADATVAILKHHGVDDIKKWVDDFVFFRCPTSSTAAPNTPNPIYTYRINLDTILRISKPLGIPWHPITSKVQDFAFIFDYFGFTWTLPCSPTDPTRTVSLPDKKRTKLLTKVNSFLDLARRPVNRKTCTSLHGSLQQRLSRSACIVMPS